MIASEIIQVVRRYNTCLGDFEKRSLFFGDLQKFGLPFAHTTLSRNVSTFELKYSYIPSIVPIFSDRVVSGT